MKLKAITSFVSSDGLSVRYGEIIEATDKTAKAFIEAKLVVPIEEPKKKKKVEQ